MEQQVAALTDRVTALEKRTAGLDSGAGTAETDAAREVAELEATLASAEKELAEARAEGDAVASALDSGTGAGTSPAAAAASSEQGQQHELQQEQDDASTGIGALQQWSDTFLETPVHFLLLPLAGSWFVWAGVDSPPSLPSVTMATPSRFSSTPLASMILGSGSADLSDEMLAQRLAKRLGCLVYAAVYVPRHAPSMRPWIEKQLLARMQSTVTSS